MDEVSSKGDDDTFETLFRVVDDYFAKRARCRGGKASDEDESMREYCIAWMRFLYLTKKDAERDYRYVINECSIRRASSSIFDEANNDKKMNDEAEHNELKRFYDALEKSSKESGLLTVPASPLVSVLRSAAMDCEKKLEEFGNGREIVAFTHAFEE